MYARFFKHTVPVADGNGGSKMEEQTWVELWTTESQKKARQATDADIKAFSAAYERFERIGEHGSEEDALRADLAAAEKEIARLSMGKKK